MAGVSVIADFNFFTAMKNNILITIMLKILNFYFKNCIFDINYR